MPVTDDEKELKNELDFDYRRWLAIYMLHTGEWRNAANGFDELLDPKWETLNNRSSFEITRDIALTRAYLGEYKKALNNITKARALLDSLQETSPPSNHETAFLVKQSGLEAVKATIYLLSGKYQDSLMTASKSLAILEDTLGSAHFKTLAVANLKAWCLVYQHRFAGGESEKDKPPTNVQSKKPLVDVQSGESLVDVESLSDVELLCQSTFSKLALNLGRRHPLTLESMECLVRIFILQGRFAEAIDTGTSLYNNVAETLGKYHPQAISCQYQRAAAHFARGNYRTSESLCREVLRDATNVLGLGHPRTVEFSCELARACLYHGKIEEALEKSKKATVQQVQIYLDYGSFNLMSTTQNLFRELQNLLTDKPKCRLHPDLICSLQLIAEIELRKHQISGLDGDLDLAEQILRFLVESPLRSGGTTSILKASVDYDLAIVLQERQPGAETQNYESIKILEKVVQVRRRLLGEDHADTLRAHSELLRGRFIRDMPCEEKNPKNTIDWQGFISSSDNIWNSLESRYGSQFPQTLYARLSRLITSSILRRFQYQWIEKEAQSISSILSSPQFVSERLVESILTRNAPAKFLIEFKIMSLASQLLDSAEEDIDNATKENSNESLRRALVELVKASKQLISSSDKSSLDEKGRRLSEGIAE